VESALYAARSKEAALREGTVPALCWELAQLQDTYILEGDYHLKVTRQEYYLAQQRKVRQQIR
jgi:HAUS augmin-like complex subunit 3